MEKLWAPIDKGLCEIGRFVLLRPLFSGLMLFVAAVLTVVVNHAHDFFTNEPMTVALMPLVAADKGASRCGSGKRNSCSCTFH